MEARPLKLAILVPIACVALLVFGGSARAADADAVATFVKDIKPFLEENCFDCHADGAKKGGVSFDLAPTDAALVQEHELWAKVLKNVRSGLMPPPKKGKLPAEDVKRLEQWVKYAAF